MKKTILAICLLALVASCGTPADNPATTTTDSVPAVDTTVVKTDTTAKEVVTKVETDTVK